MDLRKRLEQIYDKLTDIENREDVKANKSLSEDLETLDTYLQELRSYLVRKGIFT